MDTLEPKMMFPTTVYSINKPEFLEAAGKVTDEYLSRVAEQEYPVYQTEMMRDEKLQPLVDFIAQSCWTILDSQGFAMNGMQTIMTDCWGQKFLTGGSHMEHVHAYNTQMSAFYFIETPEDCSMIVFHDPRHTKRQINLMEKDRATITDASEAILMKLNAGDLYLANSWLPHGFSPNNSKQPFKFIHFNLTTMPIPVNQNQITINTAEVI
jgi:uncharacterized protein (TIGR02466 family)